MSERYIEKTFLYLLVLSLVLHLGAVALVLYLPEPGRALPKEPVLIDLQQVPELKEQQPRQQDVKRFSDQRRRVERETAPPGVDLHDRPAPRPQPQVQTRQAAPRKGKADSRQAVPLPDERRENQVPPGSSAASLLKPKGQFQRRPQPQLFPAANRMAKLEESYRRKFEDDVTEGDTKFLNSDDIHFGSFLRRFENAVYGVWRYPAEAARNGIEGMTPVRITFNRKGEIVNVQLLESSGAKMLDEEVVRTLGAIGPVGGFPKTYGKDQFHLIAFFQYGIARRSLR